jgi:hypothetical protein
MAAAIMAVATRAADFMAEVVFMGAAASTVEVGSMAVADSTVVVDSMEAVGTGNRPRTRDMQDGWQRCAAGRFLLTEP